MERQLMRFTFELPELIALSSLSVFYIVPTQYSVVTFFSLLGISIFLAFIRTCIRISEKDEYVKKEEKILEETKKILDNLGMNSSNNERILVSSSPFADDRIKLRIKANGEN